MRPARSRQTIFFRQVSFSAAIISLTTSPIISSAESSAGWFSSTGAIKLYGYQLLLDGLWRQGWPCYSKLNSPASEIMFPAVPPRPCSKTSAALALSNGVPAFIIVCFCECTSLIKLWCSFSISAMMAFILCWQHQVCA